LDVIEFFDVVGAIGADPFKLLRKLFKPRGRNNNGWALITENGAGRSSCNSPLLGWVSAQLASVSRSGPEIELTRPFSSRHAISDRPFRAQTVASSSSNT
jgi:hypothetical protein